MSFLLVFTACASSAEAPPTTLPASTQESSPTSTLVEEPAHTPTLTPTVAGEWKDAPSMLLPRSAHAVAVSDDYIIALGGTDEKRKPVLDVEIFDGTEWRFETKISGEGLNAASASVVGQKLYLVGGFLAVSSFPTTDVHIYDLQTKTWSKGASLPNARGGHAAVVLDGEIHIMGGGNSESTIADHSVYDPASDVWRELAPLPRKEGSPAAVVVNGKIYSIGGRSGSIDFGDVYIYDPASDTWTMGPSIEPRGTAGAVYYCDAIYLIGGESQAQRRNLESVLRLTLDNKTWESVTSLPEARKFARAVLFKNSIYVVGGSIVPATSHSPVGSVSVLFYSQPGCP